MIGSPRAWASEIQPTLNLGKENGAQQPVWDGSRCDRCRADYSGSELAMCKTPFGGTLMGRWCAWKPSWARCMLFNFVWQWFNLSVLVRIRESLAMVADLPHDVHFNYTLCVQELFITNFHVKKKLCILADSKLEIQFEAISIASHGRCANKFLMAHGMPHPKSFRRWTGYFFNICSWN